MINDPADTAMSLGDITGLNTVISTKLSGKCAEAAFFMSF